MITIEQKSFKNSYIMGISELHLVGTGIMQCDWCFGFTLYTISAPIEVKLKRFSNSSDRDATNAVLAGYTNAISGEN